eukprot:scaffold17343_cov66-Phaeocystis_antarctica.AAC.3
MGGAGGDGGDGGEGGDAGGAGGGVGGEGGWDTQMQFLDEEHEPELPTPRELVGQVKCRGGGITLACRRDESATAGAALDHVVAPGGLNVAGRHRRQGWRRRRQWRQRRRRRRRGRGEHADALPERGA